MQTIYGYTERPASLILNPHDEKNINDDESIPVSRLMASSRRGLEVLYITEDGESSKLERRLHSFAITTEGRKVAEDMFDNLFCLINPNATIPQINPTPMNRNFVEIEFYDSPSITIKSIIKSASLADNTRIFLCRGHDNVGHPFDYSVVVVNNLWQTMTTKLIQDTDDNPPC